MSEQLVIQKAEFNPQIKRYILFVVALAMLISMVGIPLLIIWLLGWGQYIGRRYFEKLECTLTERHLEFKKGIFFRVEKTIPLENIQDLTFLDNPFLRIFDLRILKVETAGNSNPNGTDMKLIGILEAAGFKEKVLQQREVLRKSESGDMSYSFTSTDESLVLLREIRDLLKEGQGK